MIYYYSATGNTKYAAKYLGEKLNEEAIDILTAGKEVKLPEDDESIGLMFPIYCWGIPPVITRFILKNFTKFLSERYVWAACTCGDETGTAMKKFDRYLLKQCGRKADALWSVIMPNTYVMLPGFDVDSKKKEKEKLDGAPPRLDEMAKEIKARTRGIYNVHEGSMPGLRSSIFPIFEKWGVNTQWWHVSEACIGCGKCERICPAKNIKLADARPEWGKTCFSCCACFHCCPVKAISYACFTKNKSQYLCPIKV